jgi:hypothetical protein
LAATAITALMGPGETPAQLGTRLNALDGSPSEAYPHYVEEANQKIPSK